MARSPRILLPGAFYHVMNRGAARRTIFRNNFQRRLFIDLLQSSAEKFGTQIHAYCLMDNHFHLLIRTPRTNLSEAMQWISNQYARRVNISERVDGPVFRGRFRAIVIDADDYLVQVSRYIHLNPVKAKLCAQPKDYAWSSYAGYLEEKQRPSWLHVNEVLSRVGPGNTVQAYASVVENPLLPSLDDFYRPGRSRSVLGSKQFQRHLLNIIDSSHRAHAEMRRSAGSIATHTVIEAVSIHLEIPRDEIIVGVQGKRSIGRICAMYLVKKLSMSNSANIATCFGISASAVSVGVKRFEERFLNQLDLQAKISEIESKLRGEDNSLDRLGR